VSGFHNMQHSEGRGGAAGTSSSYSMSMQEHSMSREEYKNQRDKQADLNRIADKIGCTLIQLSLAWCLKNDNVQCVLLGASTPEQFIEQLCCLQACTDID
jgi:aryl-alcohol dehydrogenase-like predicted oxidoreductase